jgi:endonuclease YncB( thermonuclease family)
MNRVALTAFAVPLAFAGVLLIWRNHERPQVPATSPPDTAVMPRADTSGKVTTDADIVGRASVNDGDTLEVRGAKIRLHGIDAPEGKQACSDANGQPYRCGETATAQLARLLGDTEIRCSPTGKDRWARITAVCYLGALDVNGWMVEQGYALAFRQYSTAYVAAEETAAAARRGLWAGSFEAPWDHRARERASHKPPTAN